MVPLVLTLIWKRATEAVASPLTLRVWHVIHVSAVVIHAGAVVTHATQIVFDLLIKVAP